MDRTCMEITAWVSSSIRVPISTRPATSAASAEWVCCTHAPMRASAAACRRRASIISR